MITSSSTIGQFGEDTFHGADSPAERAVNGAKIHRRLRRRATSVIDGPPAARRRRSFRVRLDVLNGAVAAGERVSYTLLNQTKHAVLAGADYGFERRSALSWHSKPITEGRVGGGGPVEAGQRSEESSVHVPDDFRPGRYRLTSYATPLDQNGVPISHGIWPVQIKLVSKAFRIRLPA